MTTVKGINLFTITTFYIRSQCFRTIRTKHGINYQCITVLLACYLYTISKGVNEFNITPVYKFTSYYAYPLFNRYMSKLLDSNLINLSGRKYSITELGYSAIQEISDNNNNVLYSFCNKYNIEL